MSQLDPDDERVFRTALLRFVMGDTATNEFETWIYESQPLGRLLGKAEYAEIAGYDYRNANVVGELRVCLERLLEHRWPGSLERTRAQVACEGIVDGTIDLVRGCHILAALAAKGVEGISSDFVIWDDEFDGYPTADRCSLWGPVALKHKLSFVEGLRTDIVGAARAVLERLEKGG
jgi:hypothetical protein